MGTRRHLSQAVAVEAEEPSVVDTFEVTAHRIHCCIGKKEDCHSFWSKQLEEWSCHKVDWGGDRNSDVEGREEGQIKVHQGQILLWAMGPTSTRTLGRTVWFMPQLPPAPYWLRTTSVSTKSPSPPVSPAPGLSKFPQGRESLSSLE